LLLRSRSQRRLRRAQATFGLGSQKDDPSALLFPYIHPSAWKGYSPKFACRGFSEVGLPLYGVLESSALAGKPRHKPWALAGIRDRGEASVMVVYFLLARGEK